MLKTGQIAAMARDGTLMLGDASAKLRAIAGPRYADVAWSPAGQLAACTRDEPGLITLLDPNGNEDRTLAQSGTGCRLAWAPDSHHIAATTDTGRLIVACTCPGRSLLLVGAHAGGTPTWSPDGTAIAYNGFLELRAVSYPGGHSVLISDNPSWLIAWLDGSASRRVQRLADAYPCCGP